MDKKYILMVLILAILIILFNKLLSQNMPWNKLFIENFVNTTYPSVPCKKITLSSTDNNIYLFGILFYDNNGQLLNPLENLFLSSTVYDLYEPNIAATGLYNYITTKNISRNILSLQKTLINYSTSDNSININFKDVNGRNVDLPTEFGTWNINSKSTWVSATADSYNNPNSIGYSYWSITFPSEINLSAIELIGTTSVNTTIKVDITDSDDKITFTQTLPKTEPRDYYRQIIIPNQSYVPNSSKDYLNSKSVNSNSKSDSFFNIQEINKNTTTPFTTTPYNTKYLNNIQNQINNGYTMFNNNRFAIMDNQIRLDTLYQRINKLLSNLNILNNVSKKEKTQTNDITFY